MTDNDFFSFDEDPMVIHLLECQLTYRCNIDCKYCFNPTHKSQNELTTEVWKRIIREAKDQGARASIFTGGEPALRKDLIDLVEYAHLKGLSTAISTNGILLERKLLIQLAPISDVLQISIHPWRYMNNLENELENFLEKIKLFKHSGGKKAVFNIVLYRGMVEKLQKVLRIISDKDDGVLDAVGIQGAHPYGYGYLNQSFLPTISEFNSASEIIKNFNHESNVEIQNKLVHYFDVSPNVWGYYGIIVNPEGYALPMIEGADTLFYLLKEIEFDNIKNKKLKDVWKTSKIFNKFRGQDWLKGPCKDCQYKKTCRGGSRLNAFLFTGDMYETDPFCILSHHNNTVVKAFSGKGLPVLQ